MPSKRNHARLYEVAAACQILAGEGVDIIGVFTKGKNKKYAASFRRKALGAIQKALDSGEKMAVRFTLSEVLDSISDFIQSGCWRGKEKNSES